MVIVSLHKIIRCTGIEFKEILSLCDVEKLTKKNSPGFMSVKNQISYSLYKKSYADGMCVLLPPNVDSINNRRIKNKN